MRLFLGGPEGPLLALRVALPLHGSQLCVRRSVHLRLSPQSWEHQVLGKGGWPESASSTPGVFAQRSQAPQKMSGSFDESDFSHP